MTSFFKDRNAPPQWITLAGVGVAGVVAIWVVLSALFSGDETDILNNASNTGSGPTTATFSPGASTQRTTLVPSLDAGLLKRASRTAVQVAVGGEPEGPIGQVFRPAQPVLGISQAVVASAHTIRNDSGIAAALIEVSADKADGTEPAAIYYAVVFAWDDPDWDLGHVILVEPGPDLDELLERTDGEP